MIRLRVAPTVLIHSSCLSIHSLEGDDAVSTASTLRGAPTYRRGMGRGPVYRKIMNSSGLVSLLIMVAAGSALVVAAANPDGISAGARWGAVLGAIIGGDLGVTYLCMWASRRAVRDELPAIAQAAADQVVDRLADEMDKRGKAIAGDSVTHTVALIREYVTGDLMAEMLDAAVARARTYGMVVEADRRGKVAQLRRD